MRLPDSFSSLLLGRWRWPDAKKPHEGDERMPIYMLEGSYTAESWAAQLKNPQNRVESVGKALCESAGGKLIGAWYCFGDHDLVVVADMPDNQSMTALS